MSKLYQGPIIDAHHHLWNLSMGCHPWITGEGGGIAALGDVGYLRRDYLVEDYLADVGDQPVVGSVFVEAVWDRTHPPEEEIAWLEGLPRSPGIAARSIAWAPLKAQDVAATLERLAAHPTVVGVRETIRWHPDPTKRWTEAGLLDDPAWRRGMAMLRRHGLLLEFLMNPYQADDVVRLAQEHPDQVFVVNHCGTPVDRDEDGMARWRRGLQAMGRLPNVAIKVSNFGAYGPDKSPQALRATVLTCVDAFGTKRSMFGTDYPVGRRNLSYAQTCESFRGSVAEFSEAEQRDLFHDNAARYYRFEV